MHASCDVLSVNRGEHSGFSGTSDVDPILSPPPSFQQCPRCDDMMETHCKWFYRLYILLRDEKGGELIVSLSGKEVCVLCCGCYGRNIGCLCISARCCKALIQPTFVVIS